MENENKKNSGKSTQLSIKLTLEEKQRLTSETDSLGISISELCRMKLAAPLIGTFDIVIKCTKKQRDLFDRLYGGFSSFVELNSFKSDIKNDLNYNIRHVLIAFPQLDYTKPEFFEDFFEGKGYKDWESIFIEAFPEIRTVSED